MHNSQRFISWPEVFADAVQINASCDRVWQLITVPELMQRWMSDETLEIYYQPQAGGEFVVRGAQHWVPFENRGTVLSFDPPARFSYSHLSSLSALPDRVENYCILDFRCSNRDRGTQLSLEVSNFPTASIYHHMAFYWKVTLQLIKKIAEKH